MNNYNIIRLIGKGGHGEVYECIDKNGKKVAIKRVNFDKHRYILETSIMSTYIHPYLASSEHIFIEDGKLHIVQKLAKNDLSILSKNNPLDLKIAKVFIRMIVEALIFLHRKKIVHGDIKAKNILLYDNNTIKVSDFGLSTFMVLDESHNTISTPTHKPPECYNKKGWSYPADMWSLGCTIYELVYGKFIFSPQQPEYRSELLGNSTLEKNNMIWFSISEWLGKNEKMNVSTTINDKKIDLSKIPFKRVSHPNIYFKREYNEVNDLIMKLLKYEPNDRITSEEIIYHPFLQIKLPPIRSYKIASNKKYDISSYDLDKIESFTLEKTQRDIAIKLLSICPPVFNTEKDNINKYKLCVYLSYLLLRKNPPKEVVCCPIKLLLYLEFRIHESIL